MHLKDTEFFKVLYKMHKALKTDGVAYISVKLKKDYSGYEDNRFFTYYSRETLNKLIISANFEIIESWTNLILKKRKN